MLQIILTNVTKNNPRLQHDISSSWFLLENIVFQRSLFSQHVSPWIAITHRLLIKNEILEILCTINSLLSELGPGVVWIT